jgi:hypothetical protein
MFSARSFWKPLVDMISFPSNLFLNPLVLLNTVSNPVKFSIVYWLRGYWSDVSQRGFFSYVTTDLDARLQETKAILSAINLPDKQFVAQVELVKQKMNQGLLKTYLDSALKEVKKPAAMQEMMICQNVGFLFVNGIVSGAVGLLSENIGNVIFVLLVAAQLRAIFKANEDADHTPKPEPQPVRYRRLR